MKKELHVTISRGNSKMGAIPSLNYHHLFHVHLLLASYAVRNVMQEELSQDVSLLKKLTKRTCGFYRMNLRSSGAKQTERWLWLYISDLE